MSKANVSIIEAQMGEGKTLTATGIMVDNYYANIYGMRSNLTGKFYSIQPHKLDVVKLVEQGEKPRLIYIPNRFETFSSHKLFCNYHLYGVKYVYSNPATIVELLNTAVISSGDLVIDEGYITGEARRGMNTLNIIATWFAQQMRKRNINLYVIVQHGRFIDWRFRYIAKRKILTSYNDRTHWVRLLIQNLNKGTERYHRFFGPTYWKFYDTNELPEIPERMVEKAAGWAR